MACIDKAEVFHTCCILAKSCAIALGRDDDSKESREYIQRLAVFIYNEQLAHIAKTN